MRKTGLILLAALAAAAPLWADEPVDERRPLSSTGAVEIEMISGTIKVIGWDRSEVEITGRLQSEYEREYYSGIISERRAKAIRHRATPGWGYSAFEWLSRAMECYERAEKIRPKDNDDATLRWNSCARLIMADSAIEPGEYQSSPAGLE